MDKSYVSFDKLVRPSDSESFSLFLITLLDNGYYDFNDSESERLSIFYKPNSKIDTHSISFLNSIFSFYLEKYDEFINNKSPLSPQIIVSVNDGEYTIRVDSYPDRQLTVSKSLKLMRKELLCFFVHMDLQSVHCYDSNINYFIYD